MLPRRALLAAPFLAACVPAEEPQPVTTTVRETGPMGMVFFSVEFHPGLRAGLPSRSQVTLVEGAANNAPIARTLAGPGIQSGADFQEAGMAGRVYALMMPARPFGLGRIVAEPDANTILRRTIFILPPLPFTPRPGVALYLGSVAVQPHTWQASREPEIQPSSHRALRDRMARDLALLRPTKPALAGLPVEALPRHMAWPNDLPPRGQWQQAGGAPQGFTQPPAYGVPRQLGVPPGTPLRQVGQPAPPPGFGPPGIAPGRFGRGAAQ